MVTITNMVVKCDRYTLRWTPGFLPSGTLTLGWVEPIISSWNMEHGKWNMSKVTGCNFCDHITYACNAFHLSLRKKVPTSERPMWKEAEGTPAKKLRLLIKKPMKNWMLPSTCDQGHRSFSYQASGVTSSLASWLLLCRGHSWATIRF